DRPRSAGAGGGPRARAHVHVAARGGAHPGRLHRSDGGAMRVGLHADAVAHAIPGGVGFYVRCLVAELLREPDDVDLRLLVSRSSRPLPEAWPRSAVERSILPLRPLYGAWNFLRLPAVKDLDIAHATGLVVPPARG